MPQTARLVKNVSFNLSSNYCVFIHIGSVILLFTLVMKNYCLFIRTFIIIDCDKRRVVESTYMVMFMKTDFLVLREVPKKKIFFKAYACAITLT